MRGERSGRPGGKLPAPDFAAVRSRPAAPPTWIEDVTLVSPEHLDRVEKGCVLIRDGRIVRVRRREMGRSPAGATVVSGTELFLVPGLIDSHVHLESVPGMGFEPGSRDLMDRSPGVVDEYFEQLPRSYLYFGFTTLVDLGGVDRRRLEEFRRAPLHPDVYDCGEPLVVANGYPMSYAPPAQRFTLFSNFIVDPTQPSRVPPEIRPEEHTPSAAVARAKAHGAICIKTYFERGFDRDRDLPVMGPNVLADIRSAATRADLVLVMHGNSLEAQRFGAEGGIDVLAHGLWNWGEFDEATELPVEIRRLLDRIVAQGIGYQATIQVLEGLRVYFDPEYLTMDAIPKVVPRKMLEWFRSPGGRWFKTQLVADVATDTEMREAYDRGILRHVRQVVAYLAHHDANFLLGTDTPSGPTYGNLPGLNGYQELLQLHRAGLSLSQVFRAATINDARKFRIDAHVGTIEPGKTANLLLLRKSPLESVDAYGSIDSVWVHGIPIARVTLAADANR